MPDMPDIDDLSALKAQGKIILKVNAADLPPNDMDAPHLVRFRIVSLDENRTSHWVYKEVYGLGEWSDQNRQFSAEMDDGTGTTP
jgi:hypothetical protein